MRGRPVGTGPFCLFGRCFPCRDAVTAQELLDQRLEHWALPLEMTNTNALCSSIACEYLIVLGKLPD